MIKKGGTLKMGKHKNKLMIVLSGALVLLGVSQVLGYGNCRTAKDNLDKIDGYGDFPTGLIAEGKPIKPGYDSIVVPKYEGRDGVSDRFLMDIPSDSKAVIVTYPVDEAYLDSRFILEVPDSYKQGVTKTPKMELIYDSETNNSNKVDLGVI